MSTRIAPGLSVKADGRLFDLCLNCANGTPNGEWAINLEQAVRLREELTKFIKRDAIDRIRLVASTMVEECKCGADVVALAKLHNTMVPLLVEAGNA